MSCARSVPSMKAWSLHAPVRAVSHLLELLHIAYRSWRKASCTIGENTYGAASTWYYLDDCCGGISAGVLLFGVDGEWKWRVARDGGSNTGICCWFVSQETPLRIANPAFMDRGAIPVTLFPYVFPRGKDAGRFLHAECLARSAHTLAAESNEPPARFSRCCARCEVRSRFADAASIEYTLALHMAITTNVTPRSQNCCVTSAE